MSFMLKANHSNMTLYYLVKILNEARVFKNPHINHSTPTFKTNNSWPSLLGFLEICLYSLGVEDKTFTLVGNNEVTILNAPNRAGKEMYIDLEKTNFVRFDTLLTKISFTKTMRGVVNEIPA